MIRVFQPTCFYLLRSHRKQKFRFFEFRKINAKTRSVNIGDLAYNRGFLEYCIVTMKQSVSLSQLLNGNIIKKKDDRKINSKTASSALRPTTSASSILQSSSLQTKEKTEDNIISIDLIDEDENVLNEKKRVVSSMKTQSIVPAGKNVSDQSVKCLLMQKKKSQDKKPPRGRRKKDTSKPATVISLTDDEMEITDIDDIKKVQLENITNPKRLSAVADAKKTKLKDLFSNFKRPSNTLSGELNTDYDSHRPFKRLHTISKLDVIQTPLPHPSIISPIEEEEYSKLFNGRNIASDFLRNNKHVLNDDCSIQFSENEYKSLITKDQNEQKTENYEFKKGENDLDKKNLLWPQLFEPQKLSDIMLETKLKKSVNNWLLEAFVKLKKVTSRNRLAKRFREEEKSEMDKFIIYDDVLMEPIDELAEEFVPLMILHGKGIGKMTLISTIMKSIDGQILEINTSQNRSKRDLMDQLLEYCTSHYVKNTGSQDIVVFDDVDVLFGEHDKQFWIMIESLLIKSRKPIVLICRDINFVPTSLIEICEFQNSIFEASEVSSKTVVAFLEKYCAKLNTDINEEILSSIVKISNRDIRKCLIGLQFWFASNNKLTFPIPKTHKDTLNDCLSDYNQILELASQNDVLETGTKHKSSICQSKDPTLMYGDSLDILNNLSDDQEKNKNDYMVDYRIHLWDPLNLPLEPFERNIAKEISEIIQDIKPSIFPKHKPKNLFRFIQNRSISFFVTKIATNRNRRKTRRTVRKLEQMMDEFNNSYNSTDRELDADGKKDILQMDFATMNKDSLKSQILPYIYEMAQNDLNVRLFNKKIYDESTENMTPEDYQDTLHQLTMTGILKKPAFEEDPQSLVDIWQS